MHPIPRNSSLPPQGPIHHTGDSIERERARNTNSDIKGALLWCRRVLRSGNRRSTTGIGAVLVSQGVTTRHTGYQPYTCLIAVYASWTGHAFGLPMVPGGGNPPGINGAERHNTP